MNTVVTREQLETLKRLGAATIHEAQGQKGAVASVLRPLDPSVRLAGPALTVDCRPCDNLIIHYALTKAKPGHVLVIDAKGFLEAGPWGDVLTVAAQKLGIAGLVIDGSVRDADTIIDMKFPVFCRGLSIKGTTKNQPGKVGVPIVLGGVDVRPDDIVIGDRDGLVVVAAEDVTKVIRLSEERQKKEDMVRQELENGKSTVELLGLSETLQKFGLF
jgi:4-hydroxy-4-methyl-2-oxoglutarate aldolase